MIKFLLSTRLGERRWTQAELARRTQIRPATINLYYHELAEQVNFKHLDAICAVLGCQPGDLIVYDDSAPQKAPPKKRKKKSE